jgi:hypothetical protein
MACFMPPNNQSAVGKAALRQAYYAVFKVITLNVKFTLAEVVTMSPEWAFDARTPVGPITSMRPKRLALRANQELFIFKKGDGSKAANRPLQFFHDESAAGFLVC